MSEANLLKGDADSKVESHVASTQTLEGWVPIMSMSDNAIQQRQKTLDSFKAFRFTIDPNNSFSLNVGVRLHQAEGKLNPSAQLQDSNCRLKASARNENSVPRVDEIKMKIDKWVDLSLQSLRNHRPVNMTEVDYELEVKTLNNFKVDVRNFIDTAHTRGLLPKDVDKTILQIDRLMRADGAQMTESLRYRLAEQIMSHAAHPTSIDQGNHNTCSVTTIESREFTRNPGEASKLIVDIALTGKYFTSENFAEPDGKMRPLEIDMHPDPDSESMNIVSSGCRTFASQLFQVAAVNIIYELDNRLQGSHNAYEQREPDRRDKSDTGERVVDTQTHAPVFPEVRHPDLSEDKLGVIIDATTGTDHGGDIVLVHESYRGDGGSAHTTGFKTIQEFKSALLRLKEQHEFPVILKVNCQCEPFYTDGSISKSAESDVAHVVTVRDYDSKTGLVKVDNEWGDSLDHLSKNPIKIADLFVATQGNADAEKTLEKMIAEDKECGRFDPLKHLQVARFKLKTAELAKSQNVFTALDEISPPFKEELH